MPGPLYLPYCMSDHPGAGMQVDAGGQHGLLHRLHGRQLVPRVGDHDPRLHHHR